MLNKLYSEFSTTTKLEIDYYVPISNIIGLTVNQKLCFVDNQKVTQLMVLDGVVKKIRTAPIDTKEGSFYRCVAKLTRSRAQHEKIKYGINLASDNYKRQEKLGCIVYWIR
ncbi:hypothetical protein GCM10025884_09150 [Leuconostoc gelidum subsp. gelidum]|nr:lactococcin A ABC transporter permease [Leuconostoc gelidum JB7]GMA67288.1 hypothetical protein GCM10025884_09150 [Leuconostoc gelidum subsp. gelidum]